MKMSVISNGVYATKSFILSVIEWRSAATAPYFMIINSAFWWSVFYLDKETQLRLLVSVAAAVFGWDVLLSSTHEQRILFHILTWPTRSVLRTTSVAMALYSAQSLYHTQLEKACWSAYTTVALLILNPVWQYQQVPQTLNECLYTAFITTKSFTQRVVLSPLCSIYKICEYILMLRWLPVILTKIKDFVLRIKKAKNHAYAAMYASAHSLKDFLLNVITLPLQAIKNCISAMVCGAVNGIIEFVTAIGDCIFDTLMYCKSSVVNFVVEVKNGIVSFVSRIRNKIFCTIKATRDRIVFLLWAFSGGIICGFVAFKNGLFSATIAIKNGLLAGIIRTKNAFYYIFKFMKDSAYDGLVSFQNALSNLCRSVLNWTKINIVESIRDIYHAVIAFLRYWLCAHWWPNFKSWIILHTERQLHRFFNYLCFGFVYIFCGFWVNPVSAFLLRHLKYLCALLAKTVLLPLKMWAKRRLDETLMYIRQLLHNIAIAVRDSLFWPFCILMIALVKKVYAHFHRIVLQPVIDVLYRKYKIAEDYILIHFLGPACQIVVDRIPDRSPFCDDTDTELADLLPPGFDEDEESDTEGTSDKPSLPSRSLSPLTEDERDFVHGLKFPTVGTSDSSEDEFALKPKSKFQELGHKKRKAHPRDPAPSVFNDHLDSAAVITNKKDKRKNSSSASSHSESATSSSARYAPDIADLQDLNVLDFEMENRSKQGLIEVEEMQKYQKINEEKSRSREDADEKAEKLLVQSAKQTGLNKVATSEDLDGNFEVLEK